MLFTYYETARLPVFNPKGLNVYDFENPYISEYSSVTDELDTTPIETTPQRLLFMPEIELYRPKPSKRTYSNYAGKSKFDEIYDEVEKENPEAKQYRLLLTAIAAHESGFNSSILNTAGAPAYGYFQFMQDGKRWNNIQKYSGLSIDEFRNNPKALIKAAIKFAEANYNQFSEKDLAAAKSKGITKSGLIGACWLAGVGGTRRYLYGLGNPSDSHWYSDKSKGSDVAQAILRYNPL